MNLSDCIWYLPSLTSVFKSTLLMIIYQQSRVNILSKYKLSSLQLFIIVVTVSIWRSFVILWYLFWCPDFAFMKPLRRFKISCYTLQCLCNRNTAVYGTIFYNTALKYCTVYCDMAQKTLWYFMAIPPRSSANLCHTGKWLKDWPPW